MRHAGLLYWLLSGDYMMWQAQGKAQHRVFAWFLSSVVLRPWPQHLTPRLTTGAQQIMSCSTDASCRVSRAGSNPQGIRWFSGSQITQGSRATSAPGQCGSGSQHMAQRLLLTSGARPWVTPICAGRRSA